MKNPAALTHDQLLRREAWKESRPAAKRDADKAGVAWINCPSCHEPFSVLEARHGHMLRTGEYTVQGICPLCVYEQNEHKESVCRESGHVLVEVPGARGVNDQFYFNSYCSRCFLEFDPKTGQPQGRPFGRVFPPDSFWDKAAVEIRNRIEAYRARRGLG